MVFSNLLFVFAFLPLNLICYYLARGIKAKNIVMLIFSLIFYAWGEPVYILLLVGMTAADWLLSNYIGLQELRSKKAKLGLVGVCAVNLILLGIFKYGSFILTNFRFFTGFPDSIPKIMLPIGISFYTFQLLSYCIDVYRGEVKAQKSFSLLLLYVSMFHQCIAGPIVRYKDVNEELLNRSVTSDDLINGVTRFTVGLAKKALLANACGNIVNQLLIADGANSSILSSRSVLALWIGVLAFTLQIYLDFSAYSDMAIGMGNMIGIHYRENFKYPYLSKSVSEFWRRWHISLGSFFKDYVYIPLGGNRKGLIRTLFNLLIVWALTGLWHGASWNFFLWGLYFFVFIAVEKLFLSKVLKKYPIAGHIYLLLIIFFGWILFKFDNMNDVATVLKGMFGGNGNSLLNFETATVIKNNYLILIISIIGCTPLLTKLINTFKSFAVRSRWVLIIYSVCNILAPIVLLLLSTAALVGNNYNPFLYFRF